MLQLKAHARPDEGDSAAASSCDGATDDAFDCIEWLSVLAAAVPVTSRDFSHQLQTAGVESCACAIAAHLKKQKRGITVASLAQCCYSVIKGSSSGTDAVLHSGAAAALLLQLQLQARLLSPCSGSGSGSLSAAVLSVTRTLLCLSYGSPPRAKLLASHGAASCAAVALQALAGASAVADAAVVAAVAQFSTVGKEGSSYCCALCVALMVVITGNREHMPRRGGGDD
jgi:hypothetical protein